jgi:hypothetical protein
MVSTYIKGKSKIEMERPTQNIGDSRVVNPAKMEPPST